MAPSVLISWLHCALSLYFCTSFSCGLVDSFFNSSIKNYSFFKVHLKVSFFFCDIALFWEDKINSFLLYASLKTLYMSVL